MTSRVVTAIAGGVAAIGAMLLASPDADADANSYLQNLDRMGISITTQDNAQKFVQIGLGVCSALTTTGKTPFQLAYLMHTDTAVPMEYTSTIVITAVHELCPQFKDSLTDSPNRNTLEVMYA